LKIGVSLLRESPEPSMSNKVLGRITTSADRPRGPDAQMALSLPEDWIAAGATIEIALPRNLACASCSGGGCDTCERSGAVTIRGRKDPAETVEITLPKSAPDADAATSKVAALIVRIPQRGGHAVDLPRGNLLISVTASAAGAEPPTNVERLARPSERPPGPEPEWESVPAPPVVAPPKQQPVWLWVAIGLATGAITFWLLHK
jgi:hypothetical protein